MLIRCAAASVQFTGGNHGIRDVDLEIPAEKIVAIVGPSGCGKTTMLRVVAGLTELTGGQVVCSDRNGPPMAIQAARADGEVSFVFQQPVLLRWASAIENVALPLQLRGVGDRRSREAAAHEGLADVGLAGAGERFPRELSGGMQMRVSIARALVTSPRLLLLDEPMAALDEMLRTQLGDLLLQLWTRRRFTCVMVTHNIAEAIHLSHRIVVMRDGGVTAEIDNPLAFPRSSDLRRTPEFATFYGHVCDKLRGVS